MGYFLISYSRMLIYSLNIADGSKTVILAGFHSTENRTQLLGYNLSNLLMKGIKLLITLFLIGQFAYSQVGIKEEIINHTVKLNSIDFGKDVENYDQIATAISQARIILLGEQDHGDAGSMLAKSKLIRYLHQKHGFTVVAFESDFYALEQLRQNPGPTDFDRLLANIYPVWTKCEELKPFFDYLKAKQDSIVLTGFDIRHSLPFSQENLLNDVRQIIQPFITDASKIERYISCLQELLKNEYTSTASEAEKANFLEVTNQLINRIASQSTSSDQFWSQELKNLQAFAQNAWSYKVSSPKDYRDIQMGDNLVWLATKKYPNQKIIVWSANSHIAKKFYYYNYVSMGNYLKDKLGNQTYSMGFTCYQGASKKVTMKELLVIPPADKSSVETWLAELNYEYGFLDLKQVKSEKAFAMRGYQYSFRKDTWKNVFDGIFFIRQMQPCSGSEN